MVKHYLKPLFSPKSVAIFGASECQDIIGQLVFSNIRQSGFQGALYSVNPNYSKDQDYRSYSSISQINAPVELAVITSPLHTLPNIIKECGEHKVKVAIIITDSISNVDETSKILEHAVIKNARQYNIRIIGPNCLGIMRPGIGFNATFYKGSANPGSLAFVSQSGALFTAILDWAKNNDVGFSSVVSIGFSVDLDLGDILDFLISDVKIKSILLYIENISNVRSFMSAIRAAARIKPVILVKVGRHAKKSPLALSHTAMLTRPDDAFDAAVRRAGAVRVKTITQLFSVAKTLSCGFHPTGNQLAIVTNGNGPGILAADCAVDLGVVLAPMSNSTVTKLNKVLPPDWSQDNPLDITSNAQPEHYYHAVKECLESTKIDGVLVILTPQAMSNPLEIANTVIELSNKYNKPLFTCWMGEAQVEQSRIKFRQTKKPSFRTPEPAVEAFSFISAYHQNQKLLIQMPGPLSHRLEPDIEAARRIIDSAIQDKRKVLNEIESKSLLSTFHIPVAQTLLAQSPDEAMLIAQQLGFPVAMKINSPDIPHKNDVGGVRLNLTNSLAVQAAYDDLVENISLNRPDAYIDGISIEPMIMKFNSRELLIGVSNDSVFGPVITFGAGGTAVEIIADHSVALPPLNSFLVKDLIRRTQVFKMLGCFNGMPAIDMNALESVLLRVSEMVCELPMLKEMDINPLIVDERGVLVAGARIVLDLKPINADCYAHMAIHPYPTHLVKRFQLPGGAAGNCPSHTARRC
ncbi:MAG: acetate--CoA ligase family protein [Methylococcales bacterium]